MKRSTPLTRKRWMPRVRKKPRRSDRKRDPAYMSFVASLPCLLRETGKCHGRTEVDHAGKRPLGRKCSDRETVPLCSRHHQERTDYRGAFARFTAWQMRAWCEWAVAFTQERARLAGVLEE